MQKTDLTKLYKSYYKASAQPELVNIEAARFISISGTGDPSGPVFAACIEALYGVAYTIKFAAKAEGNDFTVAKLEGLWDFDESKYKDISMQDAPLKIPRSEWNFRLLIRMPEFIKPEHLKYATGVVIEKKKNPQAAQVQWFEMEAHQAVQAMHTGPFDKEPETLEMILFFCQERQLLKAGLHHEIYLSDFRKTSADKLKTILREPVKQG